MQKISVVTEFNPASDKVYPGSGCKAVDRSRFTVTGSEALSVFSPWMVTRERVRWSFRFWIHSWKQLHSLKVTK